MILVYQNDIKILKNNLKQEKNYIYLKKKRDLTLIPNGVLDIVRTTN
jgi:hypothetical protein